MPESTSGLTISEAAARFLVDERTVRKWIQNNGLPFTGEGKKRRLDWKAALPWYIHYQIGLIGPSRASEGSGEEESYEDALARKTRAEADLKELQLSRERGEVASIDDFERVVTAGNMAVQTQMLAIPSQAAPEIIGLTDLPAAIRVLTTHVEQALSNLANVNDMREAVGVDEDEEL